MLLVECEIAEPMPFLTDIDSRAAIKGSRDPLGAQAIWTLLGRHVVGELTTNTTSVRDFVILLLGYGFVEKLDEAGRGKRRCRPSSAGSSWRRTRGSWRATRASAGRLGPERS